MAATDITRGTVPWPRQDGTRAIDDTLAALHGPLADYETITATTFAERIERRRHRNGQP